MCCHVSHIFDLKLRFKNRRTCLDGNARTAGPRFSQQACAKLVCELCTPACTVLEKAAKVIRFHYEGRCMQATSSLQVTLFQGTFEGACCCCHWPWCHTLVGSWRSTFYVSWPPKLSAKGATCAQPFRWVWQQKSILLLDQPTCQFSRPASQSYLTIFHWGWRTWTRIYVQNCSKFNKNCARKPFSLHNEMHFPTLKKKTTFDDAKMLISIAALRACAATVKAAPHFLALAAEQYSWRQNLTVRGPQVYCSLSWLHSWLFFQALALHQREGPNPHLRPSVEPVVVSRVAVVLRRCFRGRTSHRSVVAWGQNMAKLNEKSKYRNQTWSNINVEN